MIKKICFHVGGNKGIAEKNLFMAQYVKDKYNIDSSFLCYSQDNFDLLRKHGFTAFENYKYDNYLIDEKEKNELFKFNEKIGYKEFKEIYFTQLIFCGNTPIIEDYIIDLTYKRLKLAKEIIESDFNPDIFFDWAGDELAHNIYSLIAYAKGIRKITYRESVFPEMLGFLNNDFGVWEIPPFEDILPTQDEENEIQKFKEEYLQSKKVFWGDPVSRDFKITFSKQNFIKKAIDKKKRQVVYERCRRYYNKFKVQKLYHKPDVLNGKRYIFFPLHYPYDSQLVYRGKPFRDQVSFAITISEFLPFNTYLVVKEHPHARGAIAYSQLKRFTEKQNIIVLHPWENSHDIIQNATAIIVINSTVALEALYYGKNVFSFGKNYFIGHQLVIELKEYFDLFKLSSFNDFYSPEYLKKRLDNFLVQGYRHSVPLSCQKILSGSFNHEEIKLFADSLISYINKNYQE